MKHPWIDENGKPIYPELLTPEQEQEYIKYLFQVETEEQHPQISLTILEKIFYGALTFITIFLCLSFGLTYLVLWFFGVV